MGRKEKWFSAVKRVLTPHCCQGPREALDKSKHSDQLAIEEIQATAKDVLQPMPDPVQEVKLPEVDEQRNQSYAVGLASAVAAEVPANDAHSAVEVVRLTTSTVRSTGESIEETAAMKIQTAYRGYLARQRLRSLRGLVRLRRVLNGNAVKSQTTNTLQCMQTLARVQAQIHSRRTRMTEVNQALQRHLQRKREKELEKMKVGEAWDVSLQTKEQIEANLLNKKEASIRRERALAYAFSHQWKSSSRSLTSQQLTDPSNPQWGWSWLERWMAARPWENQSTKEIGDHASIKSASQSFLARTLKHRHIHSECTLSAAQKSGWPQRRHSPVTPCSSKAPSVASRKQSMSPRSGRSNADDDSRSMFSLQSDRLIRRLSVEGSSMRDDDSLASSSAIPSYMASTESARARSRFYSPLSDRAESPETIRSICSVNKRLSFPLADSSSASTPANIRRHSGPPKVDIFSAKVAAIDEAEITNN